MIFDDTFTSIYSIHHAPDIEKLTFDPEPGLSKWILPIFDGLINSVTEFAGSRVSHYPQGTVSITIIIDSCIFELNECCVDALIVVVGVILCGGVFFELLLLFLLNMENRYYLL